MALRPGHEKNWRGVRRVAPNPSFFRYQPACKPGFVGHRLLALAIRDGHSSGTTFARCLEQPTRTVGPNTALRCYRLKRTFRGAVPIRFCSRCGLPCRLRCRRRGALLPHLFTLTSPKPRRGEGGRFVLCGTVPGVAPAGRYPAPYVDGARTFLSRSLSTVAGAAVRPTDAVGMGARGHQVKGSGRFCHCEEPTVRPFGRPDDKLRDEAIQVAHLTLDCFASLAMTVEIPPFRPK